MFIGKSLNFDGNWSRNGSRGSFGGQMVPGREKNVKKCQKLLLLYPVFRILFACLRALVFLVFFLKAFFLFPGPIKVPKGPERGQKEAQREQKGGPKAPRGTCENYGVYCMGATWGPPGEGPETTFFQERAAKGPP